MVVAGEGDHTIRLKLNCPKNFPIAPTLFVPFPEYIRKQ